MNRRDFLGKRRMPCFRAFYPRAGLLLLSLLGLARASLFSRTAGQRGLLNHEELGSRLLQVDGKSMLDTVLSASGQAATGGLTTMMKALAAQTNYNKGVDADTFQEFFDKYFMMQQMPTYKDAVMNGADLSDPAVRSNVLKGSVNDVIDSMGKLMDDQMGQADKDSGLTKSQSKMLEFFGNKDDAMVQDLLARNQQGDKDAMPTLQQLFFNKHYSGLDVEALKADDFFAVAKANTGADSVFDYFVDQTTKDTVLDAALAFGDNLGHVDQALIAEAMATR